MKYIKIGKIVNTHGIKGELRLLSDFKYKDKVFIPGMRIFIGKTKEMEIITSYRVHKNFDMITLKGYSNINEVLKYKGQFVFIDQGDLVLDDDTYLNEDLLGLDIFSDNIFRGKVIAIENYPSSEMFVIENNERQYMIPFVESFVENIDMERKCIVISYMKGLFPDE